MNSTNGNAREFEFVRITADYVVANKNEDSSYLLGAGLAGDRRDLWGGHECYDLNGDAWHAVVDHLRGRGHGVKFVTPTVTPDEPPFPPPADATAAEKMDADADEATEAVHRAAAEFVEATENYRVVSEALADAAKALRDTIAAASWIDSPAARLPLVVSGHVVTEENPWDGGYTAKPCHVVPSAADWPAWTDGERYTTETKADPVVPFSEVPKGGFFTHAGRVLMRGNWTPGGGVGGRFSNDFPPGTLVIYHGMECPGDGAKPCEP